MAILVITAIGVVAAVLVKKVVDAYLWRLFSHSHGCSPPARRHSLDPFFQFDLSLEMLRWVKDGIRVRQMTTMTFRGNHTVDFFENGQRVIWTTDPKNIRAVLSTRWQDWVLGRRDKNNPLMRLMGNGILTADGADWTASRKLLKPTFSRSVVSDRSMIEPHFDRFLGLLARDGSTVDLAPLFGRLILDTGSQFIFGVSAHSLLPGRGGIALGFKDDFLHAQKGLVKQLQLGPLRFLAKDDGVKEACNKVHAFVDGSIQQAVNDSEKDTGKEDGRHILVDDLLKQSPDSTSVRFELLHVFFGAEDTSSTVLTNLMFLLARCPRAWGKLRQELKALRPVDLTFERVKSLVYLQWVIKEALRLHAPVPTFSRVCMNATTLPSGGGPDGTLPVAVAKGDRCVLVLGGLHRRPDIFGDDAESFRPERWETAPVSWEYMPFSVGPRVCPGQQLGLYWIAYSLARLAMVVEKVENRDEVMEFVDEQGLTVRSRNGAKVALRWA